MSSAGKSFGTQSPPLEATDSAKPMGVSSVGGGQPQAVSDKKQRGEYFEGGDRADRRQEESSVEAEKLKKD